MTLAGRDRPRKWVRLAAGGVAVWAVAVVLILIGLFPYAPRTSRGWIALLVAGPPVFVGLAWLGEGVLLPRLQDASLRRFSLGWFAAMTAAVVIGPALVALGVWLSVLLGR